jgi:hypothetical protein
LIREEVPDDLQMADTLWVSGTDQAATRRGRPSYEVKPRKNRRASSIQRPLS